MADQSTPIAQIVSCDAVHNFLIWSWMIYAANEFWVPIVEKAFAKMHDCYENIIAGIPSDALVDLTGESAESQYVLLW